MTTATELLRRALEELEIHGEVSTWDLIKEIRDFLDAEQSNDPETDFGMMEFIGQLHPNGLLDGDMPMHLPFPIKLYARNTQSLCPDPELITDEEILKIAHRTADRYWHEGFDRYEAIRYGFSDPVMVDFARRFLRHIGIGGDK